MIYIYIYIYIYKFIIEFVKFNLNFMNLMINLKTRCVKNV
jgi:hypothetical protein